MPFNLLVTGVIVGIFSLAFCKGLSHRYIFSVPHIPRQCFQEKTSKSVVNSNLVEDDGKNLLSMKK